MMNVRLAVPADIERRFREDPKLATMLLNELMSLWSLRGCKLLWSPPHKDPHTPEHLPKWVTGVVIKVVDDAGHIHEWSCNGRGPSQQDARNVASGIALDHLCKTFPPIVVAASCHDCSRLQEMVLALEERVKSLEKRLDAPGDGRNPLTAQPDLFAGARSFRSPRAVPIIGVDSRRPPPLAAAQATLATPISTTLGARTAARSALASSVSSPSSSSSSSSRSYFDSRSDSDSGSSSE